MLPVCRCHRGAYLGWTGGDEQLTVAAAQSGLGHPQNQQACLVDLFSGDERDAHLSGACGDQPIQPIVEVASGEGVELPGDAYPSPRAFAAYRHCAGQRVRSVIGNRPGKAGVPPNPCRMGLRWEGQELLGLVGLVVHPVAHVQLQSPTVVARSAAACPPARPASRRPPVARAAPGRLSHDTNQSVDTLTSSSYGIRTTDSRCSLGGQYPGSPCSEAIMS